MTGDTGLLLGSYIYPCADDIALIESNKDNLQIMINIIGRYAKQHHYRIHPMKT
jgi:hypothetical protein